MCNKVNLPNSLTSETFTTINNVTPTVWWMSAERTDAANPLLCHMASKMLSMPASSAAIECIFSTLV